MWFLQKKSRAAGVGWPTMSYGDGSVNVVVRGLGSRLHTLGLYDRRSRGRGQKLDEGVIVARLLGSCRDSHGPCEALVILQLRREPTDQLVSRRSEDFHRLGDDNIGAVVSGKIGHAAFHELGLRVDFLSNPQTFDNAAEMNAARMPGIGNRIGNRFSGE